MKNHLMGRPVRPEMIKARQVVSVLHLHATHGLPEHALCFGVLRQTVDDLASPDAGEAAKAARAFTSGDMDRWCEMVDLEPEFVRGLLAHQGLLTEQPPVEPPAARSLPSARFNSRAGFAPAGLSRA